MVTREGSRTLIIWRHGETDHNAAGIWQGQLDVPMSDKGREQALYAAGVVVGLPVTPDDQGPAALPGRHVRR